LYDRKRVKFGLVDFGLAQLGNTETKEIPIPTPVCKRKLTSSDLANSMESPPPSKIRKRNSSATENRWVFLKVDQGSLTQGEGPQYVE
jgi:hypothetical protein